MLKQERQNRICDIIGENGQATVASLAQSLGVSQMTIRRDLNELHAQGAVHRTHGGALIPERRRNRVEPPVLERMEENAEIKRMLGSAVAEMIREGETIFLGSGTTALAVAQALEDRPKPLTVITNALTIASSLVPIPEITVIMVGGFLRRSELSLVGHLAEAMISDIRVDRVIIGMRGIDPEQGLTSDHLQELITDQAILGMSDAVVIVADHTKFGHVATSRAAPINSASMIVTDSFAPQSMVDAIRAQGVDVILVGGAEKGQVWDGG